MGTFASDDGGASRDPRHPRCGWETGSRRRAPRNPRTGSFRPSATARTTRSVGTAIRSWCTPAGGPPSPPECARDVSSAGCRILSARYRDRWPAPSSSRRRAYGLLRLCDRVSSLTISIRRRFEWQQRRTQARSLIRMCSSRPAGRGMSRAADDEPLALASQHCAEWARGWRSVQWLDIRVPWSSVHCSRRAARIPKGNRPRPSPQLFPNAIPWRMGSLTRRPILPRPLPLAET
jgi:hypothetical protein